MESWHNSRAAPASGTLVSDHALRCGGSVPPLDSGWGEPSWAPPQTIRCKRDRRVMSTTENAFDAASVVVKGHFNPPIISPGWLLAQKLISAEDFAEAKVQVITPDVSSFAAVWVQCNVTLDTLQLSTSDVTEYERLRDLAVGILRTLQHTPVAALGINRGVHFATGSVAAWHEVGDALSPKAVWDGVLHLPGTRNVTILGARQDGQGGYIQVSVEPSLLLTNGIFVTYNDHYALEVSTSEPARSRITPPDVEPTVAKLESAVAILGTKWNQSMQGADAVIRAVRKLARSVEE